MPRLRINDGYTIQVTTLSTVTDTETGKVLYSGLPVILYEYRPALPDAIAEWRYNYSRAASGKEQVTATAKLIADHLVSWDVQDGSGTAPIHVDTVRVIPEPILRQLSDTIQTWSAKAGDEVGKSSPVSG